MKLSLLFSISAMRRRELSVMGIGLKKDILLCAPLQPLPPWHPSSWSTWLPPWLAMWPRWADWIWPSPHQQLVLSDASAPSPQLPAHCSCHQPESAPSRPPHLTPLLSVDHLCWDSVSIFPASSHLQGWKPRLHWRGAAKTVSLFYGGGVCLCSAKQIRDTNRGRVKMLKEYCEDCFGIVDIYKNCAGKINCLA